MSNLHIPTPGIVESLGAVTGSSTGTSVTTASIAQIAASTTYDYDAIFVSAIGNSIGVDAALDVYLGSSGNEYALIDKLRVSKAVSNPQAVGVLLPLAVPRGSRISAKAFGGTLNTVIQGMGFGSLGDKGFKRAVSMGISTTIGVTVDPGGTVNTLGNWTQLIASTPNNFNGLLLAIGDGARSVASAGISWLVDIAIGASGSEQAIIKQLFTMSSSNTVFNMAPPFFGPFPCSIPAGTRIAARAQCSSNSATSRQIDVVPYGLIR
ncbi:MAG: hypothetical protein KGJ21_00680 [Pseudomonadota bacterium]|nr:hypothetical protein [Pseudomonadota bacterium]